MRPLLNLRALVLALAAFFAPPLVSTAVAAPPAQRAAEVDGPAAAGLLARQVLASMDHGGRPFAVVDKRSAAIWVYHGDGALAGHSAVLIGRMPGDHSEPGVGERTQTGTLRPEDATTPAGRFDSRPGHNRDGEAIVWVDPDIALAIHRLRDDASAPSRKRRLASPRLQDRRASAGCVVVPADFFDQVVQPTLGARRGVVYVMPETRSWAALWTPRTTAGL